MRSQYSLSRTLSFSETQQQFVGWMQTVPNAVAVQFLLGPVLLIISYMILSVKGLEVRYRYIVGTIAVSLVIAAGISLTAFSVGYRALIELVLPGAFLTSGTELAFAYYAGTLLFAYPLSALLDFMIKFYARHNYGDVTYYLSEKRLQALIRSTTRLQDTDKIWMQEVFTHLVRRFRNNTPSLFARPGENLADILDTIMMSRDLRAAVNEIINQKKLWSFIQWAYNDSNAAEFFTLAQLQGLSNSYGVTVEQLKMVLNYLLRELRDAVSLIHDDIHTKHIQMANLIYNIMEHPDLNKKQLLFYLWAHTDYTVDALFDDSVINRLATLYQVGVTNVKAVLLYSLDTLRNSTHNPSSDMNHTPEQHAAILYSILNNPEVGRAKFISYYAITLEQATVDMNKLLVANEVKGRLSDLRKSLSPPPPANTFSVQSGVSSSHVKRPSRIDTGVANLANVELVRCLLPVKQENAHEQLDSVTNTLVHNISEQDLQILEYECDVQIKEARDTITSLLHEVAEQDHASSTVSNRELVNKLVEKKLEPLIAAKNLLTGLEFDAAMQLNVTSGVLVKQISEATPGKLAQEFLKNSPRISVENRRFSDEMEMHLRTVSKSRSSASGSSKVFDMLDMLESQSSGIADLVGSHRSSSGEEERLPALSNYGSITPSYDKKQQQNDQFKSNPHKNSVGNSSSQTPAELKNRYGY